jgi:branched-chain amino acid transport system substrate-binding protein
MQKSDGTSTKRAALVQRNCFSQLQEQRQKNGKTQALSLLHFAFCFLLFAFALCPSFAQEPTPYAAINRNAVTYSGPGRDAAHDLTGSEIRIGMLVPMTGPRQAEGETLRRAAQMAVDDQNAASLPGPRITFVMRDESGPWGRASSEIVHLVFDDQAVALITSSEGDSAHLAEQVGNKIGVPIVTLSSDSTTTEINMPWIFRLGPNDTAQARAFARDIYQNRKSQRVVLLRQSDRDGRLGGEAFMKAAAELNAPPPLEAVVDSGKIVDILAQPDLARAQAVVVWTDAPTATRIAARLRDLRATVPVYVCRKAAENGEGAVSQPPCAACGSHGAAPWISSSQSSPEAHAEFARRYHQRFGTEPAIAAAEAYDAVRILAISLRQSGPNRTRLRDTLATVDGFAGASGIISFDHAGNDTTQVTLPKMEE